MLGDFSDIFRRPWGEPSVKVITHNAGNIDMFDDPRYPFKLEARLRPPEFMIVAFVFLYGGSETIVVRGKSRRALEGAITKLRLRNHPRLRELTITGPTGEVENIRR